MSTASPIDGPRLAPAPGHDARALVVLLHGYGSNGADMIALAPMWRQAIPAAAFVAPNAPTRCPGVPGGYQWWPLTDFSPAAMHAGATGAAPALERFLDAECARLGLGADRLVLAGFSQGTMMALHVGLRRPDPIAAIVGYSGALLDAGGLTSEVRSRPPVLLIHGDADPIVPAAALRIAAARLTALDIAVTSRLTPGLGHGVDPDGIAQGAAFAKQALGGPK